MRCWQVVESPSAPGSDLQSATTLESIEELSEALSNLPVETVISAEGHVQARPPVNVNPGSALQRCRPRAGLHVLARLACWLAAGGPVEC